MKELIKKVEALQGAFEEEIAKREDILNSRSERWQESEKGEEYQERNDRLQEMLDELVDWATELGE